ncbi:MFS transporter [Aestuariicella hydrocarbonica]|uniref:MFS transporter n=1 Tax=Pseudomaricurvus hydrocarbonicus TaxID=1470433 RepID=A0A9E5MJS4_9GAMM|nr:MFS transporter [Aestuariicella hydrocarbonica]
MPYWRLSSFYFFYFALLGTIVPFLGLYLQSLHFSSIEIGQIFAVMMVTRVLAPNIWGWLADHTGRRLFVIRLGSFLAWVCFSFILWQQDFVWVALIIATYSFFWNAVLAQFEVVTLNYLGGVSHYYSRIRLWGSVGFIVAVVLLGYLFDFISLSYMPLAALVILVLIWLSSLTVKEQKTVTLVHEHGEGFWQVCRGRPVLCFLAASFFLQVSFGSYYTFYSVYLEGLSYSRGEIGLLWALGVLAEVVVFWFMHRLLTFYSLRSVMMLTLAATVVRWWLIGFYPDFIWVLFSAQLLHAFSFGTAHAVAIELVRRFFVGRHQGQGQALYSAVSFGAGGAIGSLLSGWLWGVSPQLSFAVSALSAALAFLLVWWGLRGRRVEVVVS